MPPSAAPPPSPGVRAALRACAIPLPTAILLAGCASVGEFKGYEGAPRPDAQLARVYAMADRSRNETETRISCVDGVDTTTEFGYGGMGGYAPAVALTPGRHYMQVLTLNRPYTYGGVKTLWLDAVAGQAYDVRFEPRGQMFRMYIVDRANGQTVGGVPGSEPPGSTVSPKCL